MSFDKNLALEFYSAAGGNRLDELESYCERTDYRTPSAIAREIDEIQGSLWGIVLGTVGKTRFTEPELEQIVRDYVGLKARWVSDQGVAALMRWLVWMAWNEGYLARRDPDAS